MRLSLFVFLLIFSAQAQIRYKFGDDKKWADLSFDDSAWPVGRHHHFPISYYDSDGMVWLRYRVIVPRDASP